MIISVIIDDYVRGLRESFAFTDAHMKMIEDSWNNQDRLLVELSTTEFFLGKTRWCELEPLQFKVLIMKNLMVCTEVANIADTTKKEDTERSLLFLIGGLINCLQKKCNCRLDVLKIQRASDIILNFDFQASLMLEIESAKPKPAPEPDKKNPFKVVVNNTKKEQ